MFFEFALVQNLDIASENILESSVWQTLASSVRGSPPNSRSSKSVGLPAAASWYRFDCIAFSYFYGIHFRFLFTNLNASQGSACLK